VDSDEVNFQDLVNHTGREKVGFCKIELCGQQARQDNLEYFWIDTCCIDKNNYAELSHAIKSMFRWYRHSSRCYVYMTDVLSGFRSTTLPIYGEGVNGAFTRLFNEIEKIERCIQDLRQIDPRSDKIRVEDTKGGLLIDSYC
jgi:hypothetical protein